MAARLHPHPVLSILPPLTDVELDVAADRVRLYGQTIPIETVKGEIVAGWEEHQACVAAGVPPKTTPIKAPACLVEYVLRRLPRNLTALDRACIAVLAEEQWKALGRERMREAGRIGGKNKGRDTTTRPFGHERWFEAAAKVVGATPAAVNRLATIRRTAPDVFDAVRERNLIFIRDARDLAQGLPTVKARAKALALRKKHPRVPFARLVADVMRSARKPMATTGAVSERGQHWRVHEGPLEREGAKIPDRSVDLVHADIVYGSTEMAAEVAILAKRVLANGGVLAMIVGHHGQYVLDAMNAVAAHLTPLAIGNILLRGRGNNVQRNVRRPGPIERVDSQPILFFLKGKNMRVRSIGHLAFISEQKDPAWHGWSKNMDATLDLIASTVGRGSRVLDPCCGGGTTGEAALRHGCEFIGIDVDPQAVAATRARLTAVERELAPSKPGMKRAG